MLNRIAAGGGKRRTQTNGALMNSERNYLFAVITAFIACSVLAYSTLHRALGEAVIYW
jgi:hypothetical protein